jgi:hypothetical protein
MIGSCVIDVDPREFGSEIFDEPLDLLEIGAGLDGLTVFGPLASPSRYVVSEPALSHDSFPRITPVAWRGEYDRLEHHVVDGRETSFNAGEFGAVGMANVIGDPRVSPEDTKRILDEALRVQRTLKCGASAVWVVEWCTPDVAEGRINSWLADGKKDVTVERARVPSTRERGSQFDARNYPFVLGLKVGESTLYRIRRQPTN